MILIVIRRFRTVTGFIFGMWSTHVIILTTLVIPNVDTTAPLWAFFYFEGTFF